MNKRQVQKEQTRQHILITARRLFCQNGFLRTSTAQIAAAAQVAEGTLFLHFKNKNSFILEILDKELNEINDKMQAVIASAGDLEQMLNAYLSLLEEDENLFAVIARELPFYESELRRLIIYRQSIIRNHFHKMIENEIKQGRYRQTDITSLLTFLFGTINYYLSLKKIYVENESVIKKFAPSIVSTFMELLNSKPGEKS